MNVFISYAHEDLHEVERYVEALLRQGEVQLFWDKNIPPGTQFLSVLAQQAFDAGVLVVFVSRAACASKFVAREILLADSHDSVVVLPVYLEAPDNEQRNRGLMLALSGVQGILAYEVGFESACQALCKSLRTGAMQIVNSRPSSSCPIVAVMGTKGGTGKSTFIAATAELIASAGGNVMIIDSDLESGGVTKYVSSQAKRRPHVYSLLDAAYDRMQGRGEATHADLNLWEVTPLYLEDARFGNIYLVPARLDSDTRLPYDAMANFPEDQRNRAALEILQETVARRDRFSVPMHCVLIDSGAENNPLVSAAFVIADYGFIVSAPNPQFRAEIARLERMHRQRYPEGELSSMIVVVNQATPQTAALWQGVPNTDFIPEDPELRRSAASGSLDFEGVGLNHAYLAVLRILQKHFTTAHQRLLPDEGEVWIRPYLEAMRDFPERLLARPAYRFSKAINASLFLFAVGILAIAGMILMQTSFRSFEGITERPIARPENIPKPKFQAELSRIAIPARFEGRTWVDTAHLRIKGTLSEREVEELKRASDFEPFRDAVVEGAFAANAAAAVYAQQATVTRQTCIYAGVAAVAILVAACFLALRRGKRKSLLRNLAAARSTGRPEELSRLVRSLLAEDSGKPNLKWLRDEFRAHASAAGLRL